MMVKRSHRNCLSMSPTKQQKTTKQDPMAYKRKQNLFVVVIYSFAVVLKILLSSLIKCKLKGYK